MEPEQSASFSAEDVEFGKSEALKRTSEDYPDPSPATPLARLANPLTQHMPEEDEWPNTYKPLALGLVPMEMAFLLSCFWTASFGGKPQAHWTFVPMILIECMVTASLCHCLYGLLSTIMTNKERSRQVYFSLVWVMISIILIVISSVVYNATALLAS